MVACGSGAIALLWSWLADQPLQIACLATASVSTEVFGIDAGPNGCGFWFIGNYLVYIFVHPVMAFLLRLVQQGTGLCGQVLVLLAACALGSTLFVLNKEQGHSPKQPGMFFADYCSFLTGAAIASVSSQLVKIYPNLVSHPAQSPFELRPMVGAVADVAMVALLALGTTFYFWRDVLSGTPFQLFDLQNNFLQHAFTTLLALYVLCSCCSLGAGLCAGVLRHPVCTTLGSISLEVYLFTNPLAIVLEYLDMGAVSWAYPLVLGSNLTAVLGLLILGSFAYLVGQVIVQPLLSSTACECELVCCRLGPKSTGKHSLMS